MKRPVTALLLALLVQCGVVFVVFWPVDTPAEGAALQVLTPFAIDKVDTLIIGDGFDNEAVLVKSGDLWLMPALENLPADNNKVNALLEGITTGKGSWPIAQSPSAHQRFQVASHYYQRRLSLLSGSETLGTIYLGTSPGYRKVHARNESQEAIYSVTLSNFEIPAISAGWLDPRLLQIRAPLGIDTDLYSLNYENGRWLSGGGGTPDDKELETLITALKTLQVEGIAEGDMQRELAALEADLILEVQSLAGKFTLELSSLNDSHFIYSSEYPLFFNLSAFDYDRLAGIDIGLISGAGNGQRPAPHELE